ncbi:MAG: DUF2508 family protein [Oscillospiraceae bacterium]|nr:DUF2508 family protein [Oscillospiraceae bacterium]
MLNSIFDELPNTQTIDVTDQQAVLLQQIDSTRQKMKLAENLFDMSTNDALTDACIYQMKALGSYYRYLMDEVRRCGGSRQPAEKHPVLGQTLKAAGLL